MTALQQLCGRILQGQPLDGDDLIALALLLCMLGSLSHLLTMLITRWGDRYIAVKSLTASILIHAVCFLGLEVFDPNAEAADFRSERQNERPELIAEILVESDQAVPSQFSGNTWRADQPTEPDVRPERLPVESDVLTPTEEPDRPEAPVNPINVEAVDASPLPDEALIPQLAPEESFGERRLPQPAVVDPAEDLQTEQPPATARTRAADAERTVPDPGAIVQPDGLEQRSVNGDIRQLSPEWQPEDRSMDLSRTESLKPDLLTPAENADADRILVPAAPLPSPDPNPVAEMSTAESSSAARARAVRPELSDVVGVTTPFELRPRPNQTNGDLLPTAPDSLINRYDSVRTGSDEVLNSTDLLMATENADDQRVTLRRRDSPPPTYQLRDQDVRREAARRFGGTEESEQAVEASLQWLNSVQEDAGYWSAAKHGAGLVEVDEDGVPRDFAGRQADTGVTALVILAYLGAGYTHESGNYALTVDQALDWLIRQQGSDGNLCGNATHYARMYCHAMATYALAEAVGMHKDPLPQPVVDPALLSASFALPFHADCFTGGLGGVLPVIPLALNDGRAAAVADHLAYRTHRIDIYRLRSALLKAVTFTVRQQDLKGGGWRYRGGQEGDISMFGWQMMSLKSAEIAGIPTPASTKQRMELFLETVSQGKEGGLFGYRRPLQRADGTYDEPPTAVMTAEALFCRQMQGIDRDAPECQEAVRFIMRHPPRLRELNLYYWYYGTLSLYQYGGEPWTRWNAVVRDTLISQQERSGPQEGSWAPRGQWGRYGGRIYSTALSTLTLEVYYRLLPLYRMNEVESEAE